MWRDTRADLLRVAKRAAYQYDTPSIETRFAIEEAVYWYAARNHGGMSDPLYAVLCQSPFSPGMIVNGPEDSHILDILESEG